MIDNKANNGAVRPFMDKFSATMAARFPESVLGARDIAVGVSGGADSMALCLALSEYFADRPEITIHALSVDHGLRDEAADEARHVAQILSTRSNISHHILKWQHEKKPEARIQELARAARYDLMREYMAGRGITHLFLGHHMDDQAETFLFRLAKGSGVDGLSCMAGMQDRGDGMILCRPLLGVLKGDLIAFCVDREIEFINDPSNDSDDYARVRLRKSMAVLAEEGLTAKRLAVSAMRHGRARSALEDIAAKAFENCLVVVDIDRIVFDFKLLALNQEEIVLRVVLLAMSKLNENSGYGARMEKVENLCSDLINHASFRKRTLGGIIFDNDVKNGQLIMAREYSR